jgi:hypothetical protein
MEQTMNDYEMMNQRVDNLRLKLYYLIRKEDNIKALKADIMKELLDTRRQITQVDKQDQLMNLRIPEA